MAKIELYHEQFTVAQMMEELRKQLVVNEGPLSLIAFFEACPSRYAMIVAFLAVLELVRLQAVIMVQGAMFGDILLRKHRLFTVVFAGGKAIEEIDQQYV